ncbi:MAG: transporter substrate-binding domain-containing protein, partial [Anaerolineae bacterium]|nr:transporter substrate-binding domain-containing protein [Anaerolineae bacterium]
AQDLATNTPAPTVLPTNTVAPPTITPIPTNTSAPTATATLSAPTLIPPTPMPTLTPTPYTPPEVSALAAVQTLHRLRVGTIYNGTPFSWLNERGEIEGYEADILRAIGIDLGIEIEFTQVTRQNAGEMLRSQRVDIVIGQQIQTRDREAMFDFSHPYYANYEMLVVLTDAPFNTLTDFNGQPVGVAIGSRSERALRNWMAQTGVQVEVRTYFTEEAALDALAAGEVSGMVGPLDSLRRAGRQGMRLINEPVLTAYYSIVMRRHDVNLRNLLNRSLQRLKASGRLEALYAAWFNQDPIDFIQLIPIYDLLFADARELANFPTDMPYPAESVQARIARGGPLRVAGLVPFGQEAPNAQFSVMNAFNDALIQEMARRWNVPIELVPGAAQNGVDLVANGLADVAAGVTPRWDGADRVEYSQPYILHGDRLAVPTNSQIVNGFQDMLGTGWWIGYFADDAPDADKIRAIADFFGVGANIRDPFAIHNEANAIYTMVVESNLDAVFGDNLRLYGLIQDGYANSVRVIDTPMGDELPITFAMPRNDADFRALVNATLQDMAADGTFQRLWVEQFAFGDPIPIRYYAPISPDVRLP